MSNYLISSQQDPRRCGHCGAPLVGRFSPCLSCHSLAIEGFGAQAGPLPASQTSQQSSPPTFRATRPARGFSRASPGELVYPYESIDEAELVARANRRLRRPVVLAASVLAVSSAVYLGFTYSDDLRLGTQVASISQLFAQIGKPSVAVAEQPGGAGAQERPGGAAQHLASVRPPLNAPLRTSPSGQQRAASATTSDTQRTAAALAPGAADKARADTLKPAPQPRAVEHRQPVVVAQLHPASALSSSAVAPFASPSGQQRVASATTSDTQRTAAALAPSAADKAPADTLKPAPQPRAVEHQQPAVVAQLHPASALSSSAVAPLASPSGRQRVAPATTSDTQRTAAALASSAADKAPADTLKQEPQPRAVTQQHVAVLAQHPAPVTSLSTATATATTLPASPAEQQHVALALTDMKRATPNLALSAADKARADTSASKSQPGVVAQQQAAVAAQRPAPVRSSPGRPAVASPTDQRRVRLATPDINRAAADRTISAADKQRDDSSRYLKAARVSLKANNLSATKARLAAALAAQPDNRDALRLRSTVRTLEQQRDALLGLARSCGDIGHWACTSHNAGIALQIDSSSKEAQRLATRATRTTELRIEPPADTAATDTVAEPSPDVGYLMAHH